MPVRHRARRVDRGPGLAAKPIVDLDVVVPDEAGAGGHRPAHLDRPPIGRTSGSRVGRRTSRSPGCPGTTSTWSSRGRRPTSTTYSARPPPHPPRRRPAVRRAEADERGRGRRRQDALPRPEARPRREPPAPSAQIATSDPEEPGHPGLPFPRHEANPLVLLVAIFGLGLTGCGGLGQTRGEGGGFPGGAVLRRGGGDDDRGSPAGRPPPTRPQRKSVTGVSLRGLGDGLRREGSAHAKSPSEAPGENPSATTTSRGGRPGAPRERAGSRRGGSPRRRGWAGPWGGGAPTTVG